MPWYGFTQYGVPDIPEPVSPVFVGQVFMYIGADIPVGYLRCDGAAVLIDDYPDLYDEFTLAGVSFGAAPALHFRLPNLTDRIPIGLNPADTGADADPAIDLDTIGNAGGALGHSHTGLATHTHDLPTHAHVRSGHTHTLGSHTHTIASHAHTDGTYNCDDTDVTAPWVANWAGANTARVATKMHDHNITGATTTENGTSSGPRDGSNLAMNDTITTSASSTSSTSTVNSPGTPSAANSAPQQGEDSLPPYYSVYFLVKT